MSFIHERSVEDPQTHATTSQEDSQYVTQEPPPAMTRPKFNQDFPPDVLDSALPTQPQNNEAGRLAASTAGINHGNVASIVLQKTTGSHQTTPSKFSSPAAGGVSTLKQTQGG